MAYTRTSLLSTDTLIPSGSVTITLTGDYNGYDVLEFVQSDSTASGVQRYPFYVSVNALSSGNANFAGRGASVLSIITGATNSQIVVSREGSNVYLRSVTGISFDDAVPTDWAASTAYDQFTQVSYNNNLYRARVAIPNTLTANPSTDTTNWWLLTSSGGISTVATDTTITGDGTSGSPLAVATPFTSAEKTKLEGVATGAETNVQSDWDQTDTTADDYIENKPTTVNITGAWTNGTAVTINDVVYVGSGSNRIYWLAKQSLVPFFNNASPTEGTVWTQWTGAGGSSGAELATDSQFNTGTSTTLAPSVRQVTQAIEASVPILSQWNGTTNPATSVQVGPTPTVSPGSSNTTPYDAVNDRFEVSGTGLGLPFQSRIEWQNSLIDWRRTAFCYDTEQAPGNWQLITYFGAVGSPNNINQDSSTGGFGIGIFRPTSNSGNNYMFALTPYTGSGVRGELTPTAYFNGAVAPNSSNIGSDLGGFSGFVITETTPRMRVLVIRNERTIRIYVNRILRAEFTLTNAQNNRTTGNRYGFFGDGGNNKTVYLYGLTIGNPPINLLDQNCSALDVVGTEGLDITNEGTDGQVLSRAGGRFTWVTASSGGGGLTAVVSDSSIGGDGTSSSPLRVENPFTQSQEDKLTGIAAGATVGATQAQADAIVVIQTKLNTIETNATSDQTAAEIRDALGTLTGNDRLSAANIRDIPNPNEVEYFSTGSGTDLNSLIPPSGNNGTRRYAVNNPTNAPSGVNGSIVVDSMRIGTDLRQVLYDTNAIYIRGSRNNFTGNTWTNLADTATGGLATVATDATITGDGTSGSPLSVANPLTQAQIDAILANTNKVGITSQQAAQIATNAAKIGITTAQADAIIANTNKTGITTAQTDKLAAIETLATADQTPAELAAALATLTGDARLDASAIKNLPEPADGGISSVATDGTLTGLGTNADPLSVVTPFTSTEKTKLAGVETGATAGATSQQATDIATNLQKRTYPTADEAKLAGVETSATADQTAEELVTALAGLSGDDRLPASAVRNLPSGGGSQTALSFATPESSWANNIDNFVLSADGVSYYNLTNPTATNLPTGFGGAVLVKISKQGQDTIQTISSAVNGVAKVYARTGRTAPLTAVFGDLSASGGITTEQANAIAANTQKRSYPQADETKLGTVETSATADQTPEEIKEALEGFTGDERLDASAIKNIPQGGAGSPDTGEQIVDKLEALPEAQKLPSTAIQGVGNAALLAAAGGQDAFQYLDHTTPFVVPANLTSGTIPIDGDGLVIPLIIKRNSVEPVLGGPRNPFFSYYEGFLEMTKSLTAFFRFDLEFTHYINEVIPAVPSPQVDIRTFQQAFSFNGPFSVALNIFNARSFIPPMPPTAGIIPISAQLRVRAFNPFNNAARIAVPYTNLQFLSADATYLQFRPVRTPAIPNLATDLYSQVNNPAKFTALIEKIDETMLVLVADPNMNVEIDNSQYTINDMAKLVRMRTYYSKLLTQALARAGNRKFSTFKLVG